MSGGQNSSTTLLGFQRSCDVATLVRTGDAPEKRRFIRNKKPPHADRPRAHAVRVAASTRHDSAIANLRLTVREAPECLESQICLTAAGHLAAEWLLEFLVPASGASARRRDCSVDRNQRISSRSLSGCERAHAATATSVRRSRVPPNHGPARESVSEPNRFSLGF